MAGAFRSESRLRTITKRQASPAWLGKYQPAIRATRSEAPRISRPTILSARKLGRDMHLLSDPETAFALLALFHPAVVDIHEQHVISTLPALHPLASHPDVFLLGPLSLPDLPGSIAIAEELNILSRHPRIFLKDLGDSGEWVPFPYVGDQLLFVRDAEGIYCINWTIKHKREEFREWRLLPGMRRYKVRSDEDAVRHQLEAMHFKRADIRTVQLALPAISADLVRNLIRLHAWDAREYEVEENLREVVVEGMREIVGTPIIFFERMQELSRAYGCPIEHVKAIAHSAIWRREIRVDLFSPLLIDRPLSRERTDPLVEYAGWFER